MDLRLDSTVAYATGQIHLQPHAERPERRQSPYNTIKHAGLPPGPIDSPDAAAIQAVLHPAPRRHWLYFVTVNKKGLTKFTDS